MRDRPGFPEPDVDEAAFRVAAGMRALSRAVRSGTVQLAPDAAGELRVAAREALAALDPDRPHTAHEGHP